MWTTDKGREPRFPYLEIAGTLSQKGEGVSGEETEHFLPLGYKKIKHL